MAWALGGVLSLLLLAAATVLAPVDRRDFTALPCAAEARQALAQARSVHLPWASQPVRVGVGRAPLTPTLGTATNAPERGEFVALPLAGYGDRQGRPAEGVADPLWVKAVAFISAGQTGVVIAADSLIIPREVAEDAARRVHAACGLDRAQLYFGATHTHSGLGGWGEGLVAEAFAGGFQPGVRIWMAQQLATAACAAVSDVRPARVAVTSFEAPEWVRNRLVGERGRVDTRFSLVAVEREGSTPVVMGAYAAHATVQSGSVMRFGGDYPGHWQRAVEQRRGGTAVFLAGAVGSHAPRPPKGGAEGAAAMGEALAARTLEALAQARPAAALEFGCLSVEIPLPPLQPRVADDWKVRSWLSRHLLPVGDRTWIQGIRLGDAVWLSTPCDYSGELALDLRERIRGRGAEAVVTSFNGDYLGYVVPSAYYGMNTYETRTMAFFGPQLPGYLGSVLDGVAETLTGPPRATEGAAQGTTRDGGAFTNVVARR
ncbi:MAG: hypothetical protein IT580_02410 [Verrucomicrobiales bacterium]|nr:hypothetical protein [Verrucomicrobiales bacterium]